MRFSIVLSLITTVLISPILVAQDQLSGLVDLHNFERESLDLPALQWSDELAQGAQQWASSLAFNNQASHSGSGFGENIWFGPVDSATLEEIFNLWLVEKKNFLADQPVPENCTLAWENCGHYSQIVWSQTTQVGCAVASSVDRDYVVCRYDPAGNIEGQKAY